MILGLSAMVMADAGARQFAYLSKGQTPDQQKKDEAAFHIWAVEQSKYDPAKLLRRRRPRSRRRRAGALAARGVSSPPDWR